MTLSTYPNTIQTTFLLFPKYTTHTSDSIAWRSYITGRSCLEPSLKCFTFLLVHSPVIVLARLQDGQPLKYNLDILSRTPSQYRTTRHFVQRLSSDVVADAKQAEQCESRCRRDNTAAWGFNERIVVPVCKLVLYHEYTSRLHTCSNGSFRPDSPTRRF